MSWLFGLIGPAVNDVMADRCRSIHTKPLSVFHRAGAYYIAAGGLADTCLCATGRGKHEGAFALAVGCLYTHTHIYTDGLRTVCTQQAWADAAFLPDRLKRIDGHYVRLVYRHHRFEITTDTLGLRTLYWTKLTPTTIAISTRLDWIARLQPDPAIKFESLGSRWLLYNPLTYDVPLEGVQRLGPAGSLRIDRGGVEHSFSYYTPTPRERVSVNDLVDKLRAALIPAHHARHWSLGLSGGLDSRVLLAVMLRSMSKEAIHVHTFGQADDPDVRIARRIAQAEGLSHTVLDAPVPSVTDLIGRVTDYLAQTNLGEAASTALRLQNYAMIDSSRFMMSDGAFGEVARRQYLNRLVLRGQQAIERCDTDAIQQSIFHRRADCFTEDITGRMQRGVDDEIRRTWEAMPDVNEVGLGNYLDLWTVRTRVPNFTCDEQARLDAIVMNDMPFSDAGVFDDIFALPVALRNQGRLLRTIIRRECPRLQRYPLVKNNTTHPFFLPTHPSRLWTMAKNTMGLAYRDAMLHQFLSMMKGFILDTLASRETIEYAPYMIDTIRRSVTDYYGGNLSMASEVNWWLSFEMWRKIIHRSSSDAR